MKPFKLQLQCDQHCWNYCTATKWDFVASLRSVRVVSAKVAKCGLNQLISGVEPTGNGDFSKLHDIVHHLESIYIYIIIYMEITSSKCILLTRTSPVTTRVNVHPS